MEGRITYMKKVLKSKIIDYGFLALLIIYVIAIVPYGANHEAFQPTGARILIGIVMAQFALSIIRLVFDLVEKSKAKNK